jgi:tRNA pseudouridine55 synthase
LARRGEEIERPPRQVTFYTLDLCDWSPPVATILVDCSKGTYIRSLARDLGEALGTGAYLSNLVRTRSGPFTLDDAITIAEMEELPWPWAWPEIAMHPDVPVQAWPALVLGDHAATRWQQGATIPAHAGLAGYQGAAGPIRAYDAAGRWLGTGYADETGTGWRPGKVVTVTAGEGSAA